MHAGSSHRLRTDGHYLVSTRGCKLYYSDSKIPPDKIAAVKAFKKMFADIEALKAAMGSSKVSESAKAYSKSKASLTAYLQEVELPDLSDVRYANPTTACFFKCEDAAP
jgi:hypothetical protein